MYERIDIVILHILHCAGMLAPPLHIVGEFLTLI